jgi:hypothetical protein
MEEGVQELQNGEGRELKSDVTHDCQWNSHLKPRVTSEKETSI